MKADPKGECSVSVSRTLSFTLEKKYFKDRENCFTRTLFVPPCYVIGGSKKGTIFRWIIPEKITESVIYPTYECTKHNGVISVIFWSNELELLFTAAADRKVLVWNLNGKIIPEDPLVQELNIFEETPTKILSFQRHIFVMEMKRITILGPQKVKGSMNTYTLLTKVQTIETKSNFFSACLHTKSHVENRGPPNKGRENGSKISHEVVDNSGYLYAGLENGSIIQYEIQITDRPHIKMFNQPKHIADHAICNVVFNPRTDTLLVFSYNYVVRVFNTRNNCISSKIVNPNQTSYTSCYCEKQGTLVMLDTTGTMFIYDAEEEITLLFTERIGTGGLQITQATKDSFLFLVRDSISLLQINRGAVEKSYQLHSKPLVYVRTTHDATSNVIATVGVDRMIRFWDPMDFSMRHEYKIPTHLAILSAHVEHKSKLPQGMLWAVTGHDNGQIIYMNLSDDRKVAELPSRHKNSISTLSVVHSEMRTIMFSCDYDGYISMWQLDAIFESLSYAAVSLIKMWKGHDKEILASAGSWISGQLILATGGNDNIIKIWHESDTNSFTPTNLIGHTDSITSLQFDGFFLFSGSEDLTIRIWDIENNVQLLLLPGLHTMAIRKVISIPDENKFISCDASGSIYVYDYVKRLTVWEMHHTTDCKSIYFEKSLGTLYACVKRELIPHKMPDGVFTKPGLPPLNPIRSTISIVLR